VRLHPGRAHRPHLDDDPVEAWARRFQTRIREKVTDATFTFVAIDQDGRPRPIPPAAEPASIL
jgi:acyl-CoA hydrolase